MARMSMTVCNPVPTQRMTRKALVDLVCLVSDDSLMERRTQGMNWIRKPKRLAIYLRDGMACVWCGEGVEEGTKLTLDHLIPYSEGGDHTEENLVTSCHRCNSSRGTRSPRAFAKVVAEYVGGTRTSSSILEFIRKTTKRKLDVKFAKELIDSRGGFVNACKNA